MSSKYRIDALEREDAPVSAFFSRQLEVIRPGLFDVQYAEFKWRKFVPASTNVPDGAGQYGYRYGDMVGRAKIVADYAKDFPKVNVLSAEAFSRIVSIGDSYGWSIQELRAAKMAGVDLDGRKARAARWAIEKKIDELVLSGDSDVGITGLFSLSGIETYTNPNGALGTATWATKTAAEILLDLHAMALQVHANSKGIESPDTLILPLSQYGLISTTQTGNNDSRTIMAKFLADDPHIKTVEFSHLLATAGSGGITRAVMYKRDPDVLEAIVPQEFEQFSPEYHAMEVSTTCHARCGGTVVYRPKAVAYVDGI